MGVLEAVAFEVWVVDWLDDLLVDLLDEWDELLLLDVLDCFALLELDTDLMLDVVLMLDDEVLEDATLAVLAGATPDVVYTVDRGWAVLQNVHQLSSTLHSVVAGYTHYVAVPAHTVAMCVSVVSVLVEGWSTVSVKVPSSLAPVADVVVTSVVERVYVVVAMTVSDVTVTQPVAACGKA